MSFYFYSIKYSSLSIKIFHQCNKDIAWAGKAELDALEIGRGRSKIPGIGDVYAILARVYSGPLVHVD